MKLVATTILRSVSSLLPVLFLVNLSVLIFAILGMDYYMGAFNRACFESEQMFCNRGKIHKSFTTPVLLDIYLLMFFFAIQCWNIFSAMNVYSFCKCIYPYPYLVFDVKFSTLIDIIMILWLAVWIICKHILKYLSVGIPIEGVTISVIQAIRINLYNQDEDIVLNRKGMPLRDGGRTTVSDGYRRKWLPLLRKHHL